jgi:DNA-binding transcriptional LysR family regulator
LVVELTLTDTLIDPVQEGVDIIIRVGLLLDSGLIGKVIAPHRNILAASPAYLAAHGTPVVPEDLLQHQCLVYKGQLGIQKWYFRSSPEVPFKAVNVTGPLRSNNAEALLAAAIAGRGVVLFPTWLFNAETLRGGSMVTLLGDWEFSPQSERVYLQLLSPENRLRSRKVREVSAFLTEAIGSPPYWDRADR